MAGYLEGYGAGEEQRHRKIKWIVLIVLVVALVNVVLYFMLRTWRQERAVGQFIELLQKKDYAGAYRLWGCSESAPCKDYPLSKFMEDWGPKGEHPDSTRVRAGSADVCGAGVVIPLEYPKGDPVPLWVDRSSNVIGYAPWPECPGRHWRFKQFFQRFF